ncbi:hypothetical protein AB0M37_30125 [Micromonospora chalcea]
MSDPQAAGRLLAKLVVELRERGGAPAATLAGIALLAQRLHRRPLAAGLTRVALGAGPTADDRTAWLLHRLARECLGDEPDDPRLVAAAHRNAVAALRAQYRSDLEAGNVDLINGAGGAGMRLWDVADDELRGSMAASLADVARRIAARPSNGLYHGRPGNLLLRRMLADVADEQAAATTVVGDLLRLTPAALDTGELGVGGVTLCSGLPGTAVALGPDVDAALAVSVTQAPVTTPTLARLATLVADPGSDETLCHGLAGVALAARLAPLWAGLVPDDLRVRLTARLVAYLDRTDDGGLNAVFGMPLAHALLSGPLGVALALVEATEPTPPWWGAVLSLGDGTASVVGARG